MDGNRRTWREMTEWCQDLLLRRTGHDVAWWAGLARQEAIPDGNALAAWMRDQHGVTGYAVSAVSWELFGYPEFMLLPADELLDGQYADREHLRPIAESILAWADRTEDVTVQLRKGYVSLHSPRRKFAQVTPATRSAVDLTLRWEGPAPDRLEPAPARRGDPFTRRVRLREATEVDEDLLALLSAALHQNC